MAANRGLASPVVADVAVKVVEILGVADARVGVEADLTPVEEACLYQVAEEIINPSSASLLAPITRRRSLGQTWAFNPESVAHGQGLFDPLQESLCPV